ncbi:MAG: cation-translocating P-type ATPase, partial [Erysipelotrichaceae bacterium]|nr:cation-translocating P-type ATPase [Erysipelotrichaceae bacterium]
IQKGDVLRILPGETIPVDGVIRVGDTSVDQSIMTGESLLVDKSIGDSVYSGTINRFGSVDMEAVKVGSDSSLQKLIRMVEDAEKNQAPTQRIADKWASWLVPVALLIAIIAYIVTKDIFRAVTVLVVFCPCALVLATPTAIMAAIGQATKHGVIIKSGEALENMGKVDTIAFDKTGTITFGKLQVSDSIVLTDLSENRRFPNGGRQRYFRLH